LLATARMGMDVTLAHPEGFELHPAIMEIAQEFTSSSQGRLTVTNDRKAAAEGAEIIYAKSWGAMSRYHDRVGEKALRDRHQDWIVDKELMSLTRRAYFMHCLPVRRNVVVSDEVID